MIINSIGFKNFKIKGNLASVKKEFNLLTPIGPLSFSFANALSKASSDVTENFRFRLGTQF